MMFGEIVRRRELPYVLIVLLTCAAVFLAFWHPLAALDTFSRYAIMPEAFAEGDWKEAFHPRFGVGFPVLAGCLRWLTGLDGYRCCTTVSTLFWGIGMFPLFRMMSRSFGTTAAWFSVILYAMCPQTLIWGLKGFREPFRMAGILFLVSAIIGRRVDDKAGFGEALTGFVLLALFRGDAFVQAVALLLVYACVDRFKLKTWLLAAGALVLVQPSCWLVWSWTGWWLPAYQGIKVIKRFFGV